MSRSGLSKKDSEKIYLEILRIEKEREERRAREEEEERQRVLNRAHYENEVGRKFLGKIMAKRKARLLAEQQQQQEQEENPEDSSSSENPLLLGVKISSTVEGTGGEHFSTTTTANSSTTSPPGCNNRKSLEINLQPKTELYPPHLSLIERMQAIPPEPVLTPTIVCPAGFKNMKFVNTFTLKFSPPECCGGPREVEIQASEHEKFLCLGRIVSDTEVFLQKENDEKVMDDLLTFKYDLTTNEWAISFPELETVAYLVKPKPASRVSASQIYEIFSADGCSNYFNLGIEMEKTGSSRNPDFVFRVLNSNLATVATVILLSNYKCASVTIDESLWPSQKAVILAAGVLMAWELVQDIKRKAAWVKVLIAGGIILTIFMGIVLVNIYLLRRED